MSTPDTYPFKNDPKFETIRFIPFENLKNHGEFPKCPTDSDSDKIIFLKDLTQKNYDSSIFIFVSHRWLRNDHPDDIPGHPKYELCIKGIKRLLNTYTTPEIERCYIWIDYACIDQTNSEKAAEEVQKSLEAIFSVSDCLFTPIYDPEHKKWEFSHLRKDSDPYDDYRSSAWSEYRGRGWCRVEMWYGATVPLFDEHRANKFKHALRVHNGLKTRTHFLFGSKELSKSHPPRPLPRLLSSYVGKYNPKEGKLSYDRDRPLISDIFDKIQDKITPIIAEKNVDAGTEIFENGNKYEGEFNKDKMMHGHGKLIYSKGDCYEGEFKNGERDGFGTHRYGNGSTYKGDFVKNQRHGKGKMYSSHQIYSGDYRQNKKHGKGKLISKVDDSVFEGNFKNDMKNGEGKRTDKYGTVEELFYRNDIPMSFVYRKIIYMFRVAFFSYFFVFLLFYLM
jgi:hypothetical protein